MATAASSCVQETFTFLYSPGGLIPVAVVDRSNFNFLIEPDSQRNAVFLEKRIMQASRSANVADQNAGGVPAYEKASRARSRKFSVPGTPG